MAAQAQAGACSSSSSNQSAHSHQAMSSSKEAISEVQSAPPTPPPVSTPPSRMHSPVPAGRSPLRAMAASPLASPLKKAVASVRDCLEEVGNITRLADPRDAWLPITESRSGNAYYAASHNLSSGIGFQALVLPEAFAFASSDGACFQLLQLEQSIRAACSTWFPVFSFLLRCAWF
jgi:hypothetical protein